MIDDLTELERNEALSILLILNDLDHDRALTDSLYNRWEELGLIARERIKYNNFGL